MGLAAGFDGGGVDPVARALAAADRVGVHRGGPGRQRRAHLRAAGLGGRPGGGAHGHRGRRAVGAPGAAHGRPRGAPGPGRRAGSGRCRSWAPIRTAPPCLSCCCGRRTAWRPGTRPISTAGPTARAWSPGRWRWRPAAAARSRRRPPRRPPRAPPRLAVWDVAGPASFPAVPDDGALALPVDRNRVPAGAGPCPPRRRPARADGGAPRRGALAEAPRVLASFSSWGPTTDGRQKPDLVAPAVAREAAWPGRGPDGAPREAALTGTSAAAAEVAARALRLRIDRPELGPRAVHSLLVQAAAPLRGVSARRQGAGVLQPPGEPALRIDPPIVTGRPVRGGAVARVVLADLSGRAGRYAVSLSTAAGEAPLGGGTARLGAGGRTELTPAAAGPGRRRDAGGAPRRQRARSRPARRCCRRARRAPPPTLCRTPRSAPTRAWRRSWSAWGCCAARTAASGACGCTGCGSSWCRPAAARSSRSPGPSRRGPGPRAPTASSWRAGWRPALTSPPGTYRVRVTATGPDGAALRRESGPFTLD